MTQDADRTPAQAGTGAGPRPARQPMTPKGVSPPHGAPPHGVLPHSVQAPPAGPSRPAGRPSRKPQGRPSLGGGTPAQDRELRAQGRETVRKLLEAGLIEFEERGFSGVRVDDVVRRAGISHGTFYLYFANKDDLFRALLRDALHDMEIVTGDFPVVTSNETGPDGAAAVGAQVLRRLHDPLHRAPHAQLGERARRGCYADGLQLFFRLTEAMTQGMTAGRRRPAGQRPGARRAHRVRLPDDAGAGQFRDHRRGPAAPSRRWLTGSPTSCSPPSAWPA